jgi:hypothetical protein
LREGLIDGNRMGNPEIRSDFFNEREFYQLRKTLSVEDEKQFSPWRQNF